MINLDTCKFVVWGFKNAYHTHGHIHEGFYRALKLSGKQVQWLDQADDISQIDFSNTFFITEHSAIGGPDEYWPSTLERKLAIPMRDDCFYVVHGLNNDEKLRLPFAGFKNRLSWNVFHDFSHSHDVPKDFLPEGFCLPPRDKPLTDSVLLAEDTAFYPKELHMDFRWATDLLPFEIEKNKRDVSYQKDSKVIHYVGTKWFVNEKELTEFARACAENGIDFHLTGAGRDGVVSVEDNVRLVRESYFAPAIVGSHHLTEGYAPCRIFKNISYGQMGVTNSARVNKIFGGKLIFNPDPYELFREAKEQLSNLPVSWVHELMDEVAQKHTYLNRIAAIMTAARLVLE